MAEDSKPNGALDPPGTSENRPPLDPSLQLHQLFQVVNTAEPAPAAPSEQSAKAAFTPEKPAAPPQKQKLNSRILKTDVRYCAQCGAALNGLSQCSDCGRKTDRESNSSMGLVFSCSIAMLVIFGAFYGLSQINMHKYFPDEKLGKEKMHEAHKLYEKGETAEALEMGQKAVECAPDCGALHYEFCQVLEQENQITDALDQARAAATLCPNDSDMQELYAEMLDRNGNKDEESLKQYLKVIKAFPKKSNPWYWAASCYERLEKYDDAIKYYREFIKLDPDNIDGPYDGIARCQAEQGKIKDAVATLRLGVKKTDTSAIHYRLGLMLNRAGDKAGAIKELEKSMDMDWDSADETSMLIAGIADGTTGAMSIPLQRSGNSYLVNAVLNGKVHVKLIVDTGAEMVSLKPSVAEHLGLDMNSMNPISVTSATGEGVTGYETRVETIEIAKGAVKGATPKATPKERYIAVEFHDLPDSLGADGLLGMTYLNRYTFSIDGEHNQLKLERKFRNADNGNTVYMDHTNESEDAESE